MEFKTIKIEKEVHKLIRIYCIQNEISIRKFIESTSLEKIKKNNDSNKKS